METLLDRLNALTQEAINSITAKLEKQSEIVLFTQEELDNEEKDLHDFPDFAFFGRHGFEEWCAIMKLEKSPLAILVLGLGKGEFPELHTVDLKEINPDNLIYLAHYLELNLNPA